LRILFIFLLFFSFHLKSQSYDFLIGQKLWTTDKFEHKPKNKFNIEALDTLIHTATYGGMYGGEDFYIECLIFSDSSYHKNLILLVSDDTMSFTIKDYIFIDKRPKNSCIRIGSREYDITDGIYHKRFVIAIEKCKGKKFPDPSKKIFKAWTNLDSEMTFTELDPKTIKRIHEGYYRKDDLPKKKRK